MTLTRTDSSKTFTGSGNMGPFDWSWRFARNADVTAVKTAAGGVTTELVEGVDYTLTGAGTYSGGRITLSVPLLVGESLYVERNTEATQGTDIRNQGDFYAETHEEVFDRITMIVQDQGRRYDSLGAKLQVDALEGYVSAAAGHATDAAESAGDASASADAAAQSLTGTQALAATIQPQLDAFQVEIDDATGVADAALLKSNNNEGYLNSQLSAFGTRVSAVESGQSSSIVAFSTQAGLYAYLTPADKSVGYVTNDADPTKNGTYRKSGATGAGSWIQSSYDRVALVETSLKQMKGTDGTAEILEIADENGVSALKISADRGIQLLNLLLGPEKIENLKVKVEQVIMPFLFAIADEAGNVILGVDLAGQLVGGYTAGGGEVPGGGETPAAEVVDLVGYLPEMVHIFTYGQSLSVGQTSGIVVSNQQQYDNVMFVDGMRPQYDYPAHSAEQQYASFVPAVETVSLENAALGETPGMGTGDMIKELIASEQGITFQNHHYQIVLSAPGYGATTLSQLSKGSAHYQRMIDQAGYALGLANAANKIYEVGAVTLTQGESDYLSGTPQDAYLFQLTRLIEDVNADVKGATGQANDIIFISYQISTHKYGGQTVPFVALAQHQSSKTNPRHVIACPMYFMTYGEGWHLTAQSSRWLGAYYGLAYKRKVLDGIDWKPLQPEEFLYQGKIIIIRFHVPDGPLVFDTTAVSINTNYGFEVATAAGAAVGVSSVSLIGSDRVKIVCNQTVLGGMRVRYAWSGAGDLGPVTGPRGNLRDSQGDVIVFDRQGINKPMHNWCVIFEEVL